MKRITAFFSVTLLLLLIPEFFFGQKVTLDKADKSVRLGTQFVILNNGNIVVADPEFSVNRVANTGAVYLLDGDSLAMISVITGSTAEDRIGSGGIYPLSSGNFVFASESWDGEAVDVGAVTFGLGETGVSGVVSEKNSLVGNSANDSIGPNPFSGGSIVPLSNGNYVVASIRWDGIAKDVGAVTVCDGKNGTVGRVSAANSIVGSASEDFVGEKVTALPNGNVIVGSPMIDRAGVSNAGAVTLLAGANAVTGRVSIENSLVGTFPSDQIGSNVVVLPNSNFLVVEPQSRSFGGSVTFVNGSVGLTGEVSSSNSLVGKTVSDNVGTAVHVLPNGNYVVLSPFWDSEEASNVGAVTYCSGTRGVTGVVDSSNSIIGSQNDDQIGLGGVGVLGNGNFVILSPFWNSEKTTRVGAATFVNHKTPKEFVVSEKNSLVGSSRDDSVGTNFVALNGGGYIVGSPNWDHEKNGGMKTENVGAVNFGSGSVGVSGVVSEQNSVYGTFPNERFGYDIIDYGYGKVRVRSLAGSRYQLKSKRVFLEEGDIGSVRDPMDSRISGIFRWSNGSDVLEIFSLKVGRANLTSEHW